MIIRTALCLLAACSLCVVSAIDHAHNHAHNHEAHNHEAHNHDAKAPFLKFNDSYGVLTLNVGEGTKEEIVVDLTNGLQERNGQDCTATDAEICKRWPQNRKTQLTISYERDGWRHVTWTSLPGRSHINCFPLGPHSWFGGPEWRDQVWPMQKYKFANLPFVTSNTSNQAITDPFWFNSNGIAFVVDRGVPLFVDQNNTVKDHLCIEAKIDEPYRARSMVVLSYKIGYHKDARQAFLKSVNDILGKPSGIPDKRMIEHPVWSTWALYKEDINDATVRKFAKNIKDYGFENSQLEIDDNWETCYGEVEFNPAKFPDIKKLVRDLKRDGFRVTLWVHPFVNVNCGLFQALDHLGHFVKNASGSVTEWWHKEAGVIDFTKWEVADMFVDRHRRNLKHTGIDGLKFDAGETNWLPRFPNFTTIPESPYEDYPSKHVEDYIRAVARFGNLTEVRSAHRTQDLPVFLRMIDKDTRWGYNNGLKTLITTLLQMNMAGYPLCLPDMIGGNVYPPDTLSNELFIRWLEANTFMPALQYSRVPWEFGNETVEIAKYYAKIHADYAPTIIELMENSTKFGTPVNPPIWWNDPTDKEALEVDSEYMLGEDILVAPVVEEGAIKRDIYLPAGKWKYMGDRVGNTTYEGKKWHKNFPAPLNTLPYFIRVKSGGIKIIATLPLVLASVLLAVFG